MLTESIVLAFLGGIAGLVVAYGGTRLLLSLAFPDSPNLPIHADPSRWCWGLRLCCRWQQDCFWHGAGLDYVPLGACGGVAWVDRSTRDGSSLLQRSLVVMQAALSLVLLVGAGLLTRSLNRLEHQSFGVRAENRAWSTSAR